MSAFQSKKVIQAALGILVSAALIYWIVISFDWVAVWGELGRVQLWRFVPLSVVFVLHYVLRAIRWTYLLPADMKPVPLWVRFEAIIIGTFASFILPLRAGEFVRPMLLARGQFCSFPVAFSSIVIERFFDLSMVLLAFAWIALSGAEFPSWVASGASVLGGLAVMLLLVMILCALAPRFIERIVGFFSGFLPERFAAIPNRLAQEFLRGVAVIKDPKRLVLVVGYSVVVWASCFWSFAQFYELLGVNPTVALATTTGVIVALAVAAPSAPGFIGVYQVACVAAGRLFGLDDSISMAFAILSHVYQYVVFSIYGIIYLLRNGLSLGELRGGRSAVTT